MNKVVKNFLYNSGYQLLAILIPIITTPYLSRVIGAQGVGIYSYSYAIAYYFVMVIMLGLNNYGNRTIASIRDNNERLSSVFLEIYFLQLMIGFMVTFLYVICCIFLWSNSVSHWLMFFYVLSAIIDVNWFFFGMEKFRFITVRNIIVKMINTIAIFIFVKQSSDVNIYIFIMSFGLFFSNIILWPSIFRIIHLKKVPFSAIFSHLKPNLTLFIPVVAISIYTYIAKIVLGYFSPIREVGYFEYSQRIIQIPLSLVVSLGTVMLPRMANLIATEDDSVVKKYIYNSLIFVMFISTSLCFGLMGVSKEFVPLFFGLGFEKCIYLFYLLLPSCCFMAFANVIRTQYLIPKKLDIIYIKSVSIGAIVNLCLNLILIPKFQSIGAAIATLATEAMVCIYQSYMVRTDIKLKISLYNIFPFVLSGVIMYIILLLIPQLSSTLFAQLLLKVVIGIAIYVISLLIQIKFMKNSLGDLLMQIYQKVIHRYIRK